MIITRFYNLNKNEVTNVIEWKDDNSAKAFMFDILKNDNYDFTYISICEINENDYVLEFEENEDDYVKGGYIEIDYR